MKNALQRSFGRVSLGDADKKRILKALLVKDEIRRKRVRVLRVACAAALAAAAALAVLFIVYTPNTMQPLAAATPAVIAVPSAATSAACPAQDTSDTSFIAGSVVLSINPSVEIKLGEDGYVVEAAGLNEDGIALIEGIDFAGLSLENATIVVVNRLIERGYISASMVDDVYISVSGSTQPDTLSMMSEIIKTAASQYELPVDTVQTNDNELQVVLGDVDETEPDITPAPEVSPTPEVTPTPEVSAPEATPAVVPLPTAPPNPASLPAALTLRYLKDSAGGVDDIRIDFGGERVSSDIDAYVDIAGKPVLMATFQTLNKLVAESYLTDGCPDTKVEFNVSAFSAETAAQVRELATLMMEEIGLALTATDEGGGRFCLAASGLPAPRHSARYTLLEIDDPTLTKAREGITALQMQILRMSFTTEEIEYMLTPRYWAVMPDIIGLTEARARELLTLAGIKPVPSYEDGDYAQSVEYGEVFFQDANAGGLIEAGSRLYFHLRAYPMPSVDSNDLPADLLQYLPGFLNDTGQATLTVDRDTGMGVLITFNAEGCDVVIHAFGGSWKAADGSYLWNEQYITSGPGETNVYWAADNGDGDDVPQNANLVYEIYKDGVYTASVAIRLSLVSSAESATLTYEASVYRYGDDGPYSYSGLG